MRGKCANHLIRATSRSFAAYFSLAGCQSVVALGLPMVFWKEVGYGRALEQCCYRRTRNWCVKTVERFVVRNVAKPGTR